MDPMLESFLQESRDNLEDVSRCFLELEDSAGDDELLNDLFRSIHTIKGSSGLFDIAPLTRVVHAAEDVLDQVREGLFELQADHIDLFLEAMDQIESWLDDLENTEQLGANAESHGQILAQKLRALLGEDGSAATTDTPAPDTTATEQQSDISIQQAIEADAPDWLKTVEQADRLNCFAKVDENTPIFAMVYTPEEQCFFNGEDPLFLVQKSPGLCWYSASAREDWGPLDAFDPFQCNLSIKLLLIADENSIREHFRYVPEQIQLTPLHPEQLVFPSGEMGDQQQYADLIVDVRSALDQKDYQKIKQCIKPVVEISAADLRQTSIFEWMVVLIEQDEEPNHSLITALFQALETGDFERNLNNIDDSEQSKNSAPVKDKVDGVGQPAELSDSMKVLLETQDKILKLNCPPTLYKGRILSTQKIIKGLLEQLSWSVADDLEAVCTESIVKGEATPLIQFIDSLLQFPPVNETVIAQDDPDESEDLDVDYSVTTAQLSQAAKKLLLAQLEIVSMPCASNLLKGKVESTNKVLQHSFKQLGWGELINSVDVVCKQCIASGSTEPLAHYLKNILHEVVDEAQPDVLPDQKTVSSKKITKDTKNTSKTSDNTNHKAANKTLRVDQERIDTLMDLVGELIVAKNALPFLARRAEEKFKVKELAKDITTQYAVINRLADELQSAMMSVRMVPVSSIFQRFPRLVRDLSRRLDKNIQLVMEGEETEADKNVIESLADPLIHLVRNSLDHGIEMPDERIAAGKPEQGTLILRATPMDDQVIIEIIDDGKGIDPNVIKQKAYEKGVITEEKLDSISDQEAIELIFAAGLSSKEEASDISGRGVGMDVVRTAVNEAGGSVSVKSELGKGSTLRLQPATIHGGCSSDDDRGGSTSLWHSDGSDP
ncbi:MAG: Hpt domain-containing protein [Gammaproteobacteria bacterium]|nr:Hpt domain-containing protein [Gammaproteobacteria bacterium]